MILLLLSSPPVPLWAQREASDVADSFWKDRSAILRKEAKPLPWLRGRERLFTDCVRPATRTRVLDRRLATFAIRLRQGWTYVDTSGTVSGAVRGVFSYERWMATVARFQKVPEKLVLSRVTIRNASRGPVTVFDPNDHPILRIAAGGVGRYAMYQEGQWLRTPSGARVEVSWDDFRMPTGVFRKVERILRKNKNDVGGWRVTYTVRR